MLNYILSKESLRKVGRLLKKVVPMIGPGLFFLSIFVLYRQLKGLDFSLVLGTMRMLPPSAGVLAGGFTALAYINLTFVEYLSNTRVESGLRYKRISLAGFVAYAFSKNIGFSVLSGTTVRFRLYREWGQDTGGITRIVALNYISFWIGLFLVAGLSFSINPPSFARDLDLLEGSFRALGVLLLLALGGYFFLLKKRKRPFRIGSASLKLPNIRFTAWQLAVSSADWLISAAVLYFLLSGCNLVTYYEALGIFLVAQFAGLTSQVPGGIGVFEALLVVILTDSIEKTFLVATLLTYRIMFFLVPFVVAAVILGVLEYKHREHIKQVLSRAGKRGGEVRGVSANREEQAGTQE